MSDFIRVHRPTPVWINVDRIVAVEDHVIHIAGIDTLSWQVRESAVELMQLLGWTEPKKPEPVVEGPGKK